ncbi:MAG TPA: catalase [Accumulibacter sp.]|uniref:catalase n=1 Tax=Accumulibacter sp. TaxID=2053492 RepID=UPI002CA6E968|nr:catalase [Accumulibacter sp.]HRF73817.1 catalase [Accumulibacter sp.]
MTTKEATKAATAVAGERHWVTFRFRSQQGIRNLSDPEAQRITGKDRSSHQHGLCENVAKGRSPEVAAIYPCR